MALVQVACIIKHNGTNWEIINNSAHAPLNVSHLVTYSDNVRVYYSSVYSKVVSFIVAPDETYAINNITAGASVGLDYAYIKYGNSSGQLNTSQMNISGSNLFIYGLFES